MPKPQPKPIDPSEVTELALAVVRDDRFPHLATADGDQPRVRPVSPVRTDGFTIYVANLRAYHKTGEIAADPRACYALFHAPRRHGIGSDARSGRENWVSGTTLRAVVTTQTSRVRAALRVGRKKPACFVVGPQRLFLAESLRSFASHSGLFRPIAGRAKVHNML